MRYLEVSNGERFLEDISSVSTSCQCTQCSQVAAVASHRLNDKHAVFGARSWLFDAVDNLQNTEKNSAHRNLLLCLLSLFYESYLSPTFSTLLHNIDTHCLVTFDVYSHILQLIKLFILWSLCVNMVDFQMTQGWDYLVDLATPGWNNLRRTMDFRPTSSGTWQMYVWSGQIYDPQLLL